MPLDSIRNKLMGGGQSNGLQSIRNKLLNPTPESEKPEKNHWSMPQSELPFGAQGMTKQGQAYYGEGFKGWMRKTYGDLFDPAKRLIDPDEQDWQQYQGYVGKLTNFVDQTLNWNDWGEKVFGLSSKEAGTALAGLIAPGAITRENLQEQVEAGEITQSRAKIEGMGMGVAASVSMTKDLAQRGLWGALEVLGLTDVGMRKIASARVGIDTLADKYGTADEAGFWNTWNPVQSARDIITVGKGVLAGDIELEEVKQTILKTAQGSNAVYSMATDQYVQTEFNRRVALGEEAGFVAAELGKPGIELAGSIFGDPATYLGMGLYKLSKTGTVMKLFGKEVKVLGITQRVPWERIGTIPTFGELLHLNVAGQRLKNAAQAHYFSYANPEVGQLVKQAFDAGDDTATLTLMEQAVRKATGAVSDLFAADDAARKAATAKNYTVTSFTSEHKAKLMGRQTSMVMDMIFSGSKGDIDEVMMTVQDMVRMHTGSAAEKVLAAKRLMMKGGFDEEGKAVGQGALFFSEAGLMTGDLLSRMDINKIDDIFQKYGKNGDEFGTQLYKQLDSSLQEIYPSVDEMYKARQAVKAGDISPKLANLAKRYDDLPDRVKTISAIHAKTSKINGPIVGTQVNLYMKWNPGYAARNILSQGLPIAMDMGLGRALQTSVAAGVKSVVSVFSDLFKTTDKLDPVASHISARAQQAMDLVGAQPEALRRAMGMAEVKDAKGFNALSLAQKGEALTSADIVVETLFDEIDKALPAVLSGQGSIQTALVDTGILNEKQGQLLIKLVKDFNGNSEKAIEAFRKAAVKTGDATKIEDWRNVPIPDKMRKYLTQTGNYDEVLRIQNEAQSLDEFKNGVNEVLQRIYDAAKKGAANEPPSIGSNVPEEMRNVVDDVIDQFNAGLADEAEADLITRKAQSWQNVRDQLEAVKNDLLVKMGKWSDEAGINSDQYVNMVTAADKKFNRQYRIVDDVRTMTRKTVDELRAGAITAEQAFNRLQHSNVYNIKQYFPEATGAIPTRQAVDYVWSAYFQFSGDHWRSVNDDMYRETLSVFQKWAEATGANFDEVAGTFGSQPHDPFVLLQRAYKEAQQIEELGGQPSLQKFRDVPEGTTLEQMTQIRETVDASGKAFSKKRIFNTVNAERRAKGLQPYATYGDVPFKEAQQAIQSRGGFASPDEILARVNAGLDEGAEPFTDIQRVPKDVLKRATTTDRLPPPLNQEYITPARAHWENQDGFIEEAGKWRDNVASQWGRYSDVGNLPDNLESGLSTWRKTFDSRMQTVKNEAMVIATSKRDFLLHDYAKTYADLGLGYVMPFGYWNTRTYARFAERLVDNPKYAVAYLAYKRDNEKRHAGMPEFWRQNVGLKLPGLNNDNPVFFNLEQTLNPMNSLTGVDFNDPYKRVDWVSRTVDDLAKFGPGISAPINWAVAAWLYSKGENQSTEAARRWLGRASPVTTAIKAGLTKAGVDINLGPFVRHNEVDPFVNFAGNGLDPYEEARVNRALSAWVQKGGSEEERSLRATQATDAARTRSGPLWDNAIREATLQRADANLSSYFLGAGFKGRTEQDMKIDQFYAEYHKLLKLRDVMEKDEYRDAWDQLRDKYEFADVMIIGKKSDPERESAYAYNVLGRIPPGQMGDLFSVVGLGNDDINRFYESKGDFSDWTEGDQKRFIGAIADLGAILQMPPASTKQKWNAAKDGYKDIQATIARQLGDPEIWDKVSDYYNYMGETRYKANVFLEQNPQVEQAIALQTQLMTNRPEVFQYYGSLNTIQSYVNGQVRTELEQKYGGDVYDKYYDYLNTFDPAKRKTLQRELKGFIKEKSKYKDYVNREVVRLSGMLPNVPEVQVRADLDNASQMQSALLNQFNQAQPLEYWQEQMDPDLMELVQNYWYNGDKLPSVVTNQLDYVAGNYGYDNGDDLLQTILVSMNQGAQP